LKAYIMNEYSSQMTQTERAKIIHNVISANRKKPEPSMNTRSKENLKKPSVMCVDALDTSTKSAGTMILS
jgi:hypothetical protein